jgi:hypothetical protein
LVVEDSAVAADAYNLRELMARHDRHIESLAGRRATIESSAKVSYSNRIGDVPVDAAIRLAPNDGAAMMRCVP